MLYKLIKYELKKLCSTAFFKIVLIAFLIVNIILCIRFSKEQTEYSLLHRGYLDEVYEIYQNNPKVFEEEYIKVEEEWNAALMEGKSPVSVYGDELISDYEIFKEVKSITSADEAFHKKLQSTIIQASRIVKNFEKSGKPLNSYKYNYNKELLRVYSYIDEEVTIDHFPLRGWREFFTYEIDFYLVLIIVTVCCVTLATNDRKNGFYAIASTTRQGRRTSALAKYISLLIVIIFIALIFMLSSLISVGIICGYSSPFNAVHAVSEMNAFPYAMNMLEATLSVLVLRIFSMSLYALVLFAVSVIVKNQIICFGSAFIVFLANYFVHSLKSYEVGDWKYLNLLDLYFADKFIVSYRAFDFHSNAINLAWILLLAVIFVFLFSLFMTLLCYPMKASSRILRPINFIKSKKKTAYLNQKRFAFFSPSNIVSYELYKHRSTVFLLILFLIIKIFASDDYFKAPESAYDRMYKEYIDELAGEYAEEKAEYINSEFRYYSYVNKQLEEMREKRAAGEISSKEYSEFIEEYMQSTVKIDVLKELKKTSEYLAKLYEEKGILASFVYETGYQAHAYRGADLILLLFVVFFASRLYLYENEKSISGTPMDVVNRTSKRGRLPLYSRKYILCIGVSFICALLFGGIDWFFLLRKYQMPDMSASILSIGIYADAPNISIMQYTILSELLGIIGTILTALLAFCAGSLLKRSILTYAIVAAFVVVPYYAAANGGRVFALTDTTKLQNTDALFRTASKTGTVPTVIIFFAIFTAILIFLTLFSARRVKKGV